ncbi:UDP-glucosyltransferase 2-like [Neodiprion fabricii]|uniref:UDP-glucosyltransferase 2-like n=1 Tax=Neodiprion fabricii TaxID=2872261 RepID=UPI001ED905FF|nr:UDP-glucosyltransferase 2-like [Neodiprion fabricii]
MVARRTIVAAIICILNCAVEFIDCYRILCICPRASISHQVVFRSFTLALNKRGHEIIFVTSDPMNDPTLKNYTEIDISFLYKSNYITVLDVKDWFGSFYKLSGMANLQTDQILQHPEFRKIYTAGSNENFDMVLLEMLYWPALFVLGKRFDAPVIGLSPMGLTMNVQYVLGNPIMTSHPSNWELYSKSSPLTFWDRLGNFVSFWRFLHYYKNNHVTEQAAIARKYFGEDIPDLEELEKNVSLVFANQQTPISFSRPEVRKIVEIAGFHVSPPSKPLPKDIKKILDGATQGFIYMSLGSNMKSSMLSNETRNELVAAFSKLPYEVLWKFENDVLPDKPKNVHILKWTPQQAVLAHPNLKVFVYQGGLQSTEETVSHGVPVVGIPTWGDQRMQIDKMVSLGVGKKLELRTMNRNEIEEAIRTVASNKRYKDEMVKLSTLLKENSQHLLENAIWWTEQVLRHKGTSHLHSITADDPWYRRQDMDLIVFISVGTTVVLILICYVSHKLLTVVISAWKSPSLDRKKKWK